MNSQLLKFRNHFFPSVGIKLTGRCEYRCPFCCEPDRLQSELPADKFKKILSTIKEYGTARVCLTGGDPLLYPYIQEVLKHSKELNFECLLLTANGNLFQKQYDYIAPYLDTVRFSVHGIGKSHNAVVGNSESFTDIEQAMNLLRGSTIKRYVTTVVTNNTLKSIKEIVEWCADKEVTKLFLFGLMKSGLGISYITENGNVSEEDVTFEISKIKNIADESGIQIIYYDYKNKAECVLIYGDGKMLIDPHPTPPNNQMYIGNIFDNTISEIWEKFSSDPENIEGYSQHLKKM